VGTGAIKVMMVTFCRMRDGKNANNAARAKCEKKRAVKPALTVITLSFVCCI
jgi:hypothetical protein